MWLDCQATKAARDFPIFGLNGIATSVRYVLDLTLQRHRAR
jgi:hypothetical protein